jgi:hypothetical protein
MRRLLVLLSAALALTGAAVAGAAGGPIAAAASQTTKQGSEHVSLAGTIDLGGTFGKVKLNAAGGFDQSANRGGLKGTLAVAGTGKTPVEEIFAGNILYLRTPLFSTLLPSGKQWVAISLAKPGTLLGFDLGALTGQTPSAVLGVLAHGSGSATTVGKERVDGVQTTHYRAPIAGKPGGATYKPVDVWVDGNGLIRKAHLDYVTAGKATSPGFHVALDVYLSDFGMKVASTPPPAGAVSNVGSGGGG